MNSLATLAGDSIGLIVEYITGEDIWRLVLCGSRILSAKLFGNVRQFSWTFAASGRLIWPRVLTNFHRLQQLDFKAQHPTDGRVTNGVKLSDLPSSLNSLNLAYFDPVSDIFSHIIDEKTQCLTYQEGGFASRFPNLTTLRIRASIYYQPELFGLFPATLTSLDLDSSTDFDAFPYLLELPTGLKSLTVGTVLQPRPGIEISFPPNLDTLSLRMNQCPSKKWLCNVPRSVTSFVFLAWSTDTNLALQWEDLPRELKSYSQYGFPVDPSSELVSKGLPPHLTRFGVELESPPDLSWLRELPKSLVDFDPSSCIFTPEQYHLIPACSKDLELSNSELPILPDRLPSLSLMSGTLSSESLALLPSSLKWLSLHTINDEIGLRLAQLPRLAYLTVRECGTLSPETCKMLPQTLRTFNFHATIFTSLDCISNLPSIESISIRQPSFPGKAPQATPLSTFEGAQRLPLSLKRISTYSNELATVDFVYGLQRLVNLESLSVTSLICLPETTLLRLPPNLRTLSIRLGSLGQVEDSIARLPRGLVSFKCQCSGSVNWTISHAQQLPRSLYDLSLPEMRNSWDPDMLAALPPYLCDVTLGWGRLHDFNNKYDPLKSLRCKALTERTDP